MFWGLLGAFLGVGFALGALLFRIEKPPMLLAELKGGFSYLAFSVRRGNRLSVLLLFLLYLAYLLMASLLDKNR